MTEAEWQRCSDSRQMMDFLRVHASNRKLRLLAVAFCRSVSSLIHEDRSNEAMRVLEQFADRQASQSRLKACRDQFRLNPPTLTGIWGISLDALLTVQAAIQPRAWHAAKESATCAVNSLSFAAIQGQSEEDLAVRRSRRAVASRLERANQAGLVREMFGNPFCPVAHNPGWLTVTAVGLAEAIYTNRAFDRLPILADALEDAGCTTRDILDHCRQPGDHVRGCWVVDLVLGKS